MISNCSGPDYMIGLFDQQNGWGLYVTFRWTWNYGTTLKVDEGFMMAKHSKLQCKWLLQPLKLCGTTWNPLNVKIPNSRCSPPENSSPPWLIGLILLFSKVVENWIPTLSVIREIVGPIKQCQLKLSDHHNGQWGIRPPRKHSLSLCPQKCHANSRSRQYKHCLQWPDPQSQHSIIMDS